MGKGLSQQECRKFLAAFADGELDVTENCEVLEQLAMDPANTKRVAFQQQLRRLLGDCMDCEKTMRVPDDLRAAIEEACANCDDKPATPPSTQNLNDAAAQLARDEKKEPNVLARIGKWLPPLAVAAALGLVVGLLFSLSQQPHNPSPGPLATGPDPANRVILPAAATILPTAQVEKFGSRHLTCSTSPQGLMHTQRVAQNLAALPQSIGDIVGQQVGNLPLDLSAHGLTFTAAGICPVPGKDAVHVVYHEANASPNLAAAGPPSVSLWIRATTDDDQALEPGRVYLAADPAAENAPTSFVMTWVQNNLRYFLVGCSMDKTLQAAETLRQPI